MVVEPIESNIFTIIHNRRSIRHFLNKPVTDETLEKILEAGIRAPFAAQLYSIIYTRDKEKMQIKSGVYSTTQVLMLFLLDFNKIQKIVIQRGYEYDYDDGMLLWLSVQDVALVCQNIILAAEAFGLGSVLLGTVPLNADRIKAIFNLPSRVFPMVGLCLGYPDPSVETDIRPRYPLKYVAFEDTYCDPNPTEIQEMMKAMDDGYLTQGYYIKQRAKIPFKNNRTDIIDYDRYSWSEHICRKITQGILRNESLFQIIKRHGIEWN